MTHPNEELVRRAFDAFANGDVDTVRGLMDDDLCGSAGSHRSR